MIVLGIDSSDEYVAVGIAENDKILESAASIPEQRNKNHLHRIMDNLLRKAKLKISDLDAVSISIGPGSFTGLRVGLAAAKGICWSRDIPLCGISSLEAIAETAENKTGNVIALKDARRSEYYYAAFEGDGKSWNRLTPDTAGGIEKIMDFIVKGYRPVGNIGRFKDDFPINDVPEFVEIDPVAIGGAIAVKGYRKIIAGDTLNVAGAVPSYIRDPGLGKVGA